MYFQAASRSYSLVRTADDLVIPKRLLDERVVVPIGYQPQGASNQRLESGDIEITGVSYFDPFTNFIYPQIDSSGDLRLCPEYVRGADWQNWDPDDAEPWKSVRFFPDLLKPHYANRVQTAARGPNGYLWVLRTADDVFHVYAPSSRPQQHDRWMLVDKVPIPKVEGEETFLYCALMEWPNFYTNEATGGLEKWRVRRYEWKDREFVYQEDLGELDPYMYGPFRMLGDDAFWYITSVRVTETAPGKTYLKMVQGYVERPDKTMIVWDYEIPDEIPEGSVKPGIYRNDQLVVPKILGNSIVSLPNGGGLAFTYGREFPLAFGLEGRMTYLPKKDLIKWV